MILGLDSDSHAEIEGLMTLQLIVEALDLYFQGVTELDLIYRFPDATLLIDELLLHGRVHEPCKTEAVLHVLRQDQLVLQAKEQRMADKMLGTLNT